MYELKTMTRNKRGSGLYYYGQEGGRGRFVPRGMPIRTLGRALPPAARFRRDIRGGCGHPTLIFEMAEPPMMMQPAVPMPKRAKKATKPKGSGLINYGQGITPYGAGVSNFGGKRGGNFSNSAASPGDLNKQQLQQLQNLKAKDPYSEVPVFDRHSLNLLTNVIQSKQIVESESKKKGAGMRYYGSN